MSGRRGVTRLPGGDRPLPVRGALARAVRSIERRIRTIPLDGGMPELALDAFKDVFRATIWAAHRMQRNPNGEGLVPAFLEHRGWNQRALDRYLGALAKPHERGPLIYDPDRPQANQRDKVFALNELYGAVPPTLIDSVRLLLRRIDFDIHDQLRVVVCDGPQLLGWVGGYREEPFTAREKRALERLVPALRASLLWRRRLSEAPVARGGLEATMEAIGCPAVLMDETQRVAHANDVARGVLADRGRAVAEEVRSALATGRAESIAVRGPGAPDHELVILRNSSAMLRAAIARASEAWSLTRRQREVLALVASGDTNKGIAAKLGCAEVTVELHVTALFRKSGASTRGELSARVWSGDL